MKNLDKKAVLIFFPLTFYMLVTQIIFYFYGFFVIKNLINLNNEKDIVNLSDSEKFDFYETIIKDTSDFLNIKMILIITIVVIIIAYIMAILKYKYYKYQLTESGYQAERGILRKRYISIPYSKIQNVDIYRGIFSRFLGLSDLQIQTAGYGAIGGLKNSGSEGRLPGLDMKVAEEMRENIMKKVRELK